MLTEEQLAALFDACTNVERFVLVGDPRQLPPIGAGRPFVDIVAELAPSDVESAFPALRTGYAELTSLGGSGDPGAADVLLARTSAGRAVDPGADEVWDAVVGGQSDRLRCVQWNDPPGPAGEDDTQSSWRAGTRRAGRRARVRGVARGSSLRRLDRAFFWNRFGDHPGAAGKAEAWQILSPVRGGLEGVDASTGRSRSTSAPAGDMAVSRGLGSQGTQARSARHRSSTATRSSTSSISGASDV